MGEETAIPKDCCWEKPFEKDGSALDKQYRDTLEMLGKMSGMVGVVFRKSQNKLTDPAKAEMSGFFNGNEGPWIGIGVDIKGTIYEGLLEKMLRK